MQTDLVVHDGVEGVALTAPHADALDVALHNVSEVDLEVGVAAGVRIESEAALNIILPADEGLIQGLMNLEDKY